MIITDRNYGLYTAYATHVLGLTTKVLYIQQKKAKNIKKKDHQVVQEPTIWENETMEDYLFILDKFKIPYEFIKDKILYLTKNNIWHISYRGVMIQAQHLIFAISPSNLLIGNKRVSLEDFQVQNNLYLIGEKALYDGKIFSSEVYTGESNLVAQQIYKNVNNVNENITIHSTDLKFEIYS